MTAAIETAPARQLGRLAIATVIVGIVDLANLFFYITTQIPLFGSAEQCNFTCAPLNSFWAAMVSNAVIPIGLTLLTLSIVSIVRGGAGRIVGAIGVVLWVAPGVAFVVVNLTH